MSNFDFSKLFSTIPQVDVKPLLAAQQKNVDAFVKAGTVLSEGMQTVLKRQVELVQANVAASIAAAKDASVVGKDLDLKKSYALVQTATEKAAADTREIIDIATSASTKAFEVLRARGDEAAAEFKSLIKTAA